MTSGLRRSIGVAVGLLLFAPSGALQAQDLCEDWCLFSNDGECDDGGPDALHSVCAYGADCADCGPRPAEIADVVDGPPAEALTTATRDGAMAGMRVLMTGEQLGDALAARVLWVTTGEALSAVDLIVVEAQDVADQLAQADDSTTEIPGDPAQDVQHVLGVQDVQGDSPEDPSEDLPDADAPVAPLPFPDGDPLALSSPSVLTVLGNQIRQVSLGSDEGLTLLAEATGPIDRAVRLDGTRFAYAVWQEGRQHWFVREVGAEEALVYIFTPRSEFDSELNTDVSYIIGAVGIQEAQLCLGRDRLYRVEDAVARDEVEVFRVELAGGASRTTGESPCDSVSIPAWLPLDAHTDVGLDLMRVDGEVRITTDDGSELSFLEATLHWTPDQAYLFSGGDPDGVHVFSADGSTQIVYHNAAAMPLIYVPAR